MKYVLLDDEGNPVRFFDHEAPGTVPMPEEPKLDYDELLEACGDALL
jgi:hypothetical protein